MVQGISGKKRFLVRFQYGCKKDLTSKQLTVLILEKIPVEEEPRVPMISVIPDGTFTSEKGYYCGVCLVLYFHKYNSVDRKEEQAELEPDPDEEVVEYVRLDDERERHWRIFCRTIGIAVKNQLVSENFWNDLILIASTILFHLILGTPTKSIPPLDEVYERETVSTCHALQFFHF